ATRAAKPVPRSLRSVLAWKDRRAALADLPERVHVFGVPVQGFPHTQIRTFRLVQQGRGGFGRRFGLCYLSEFGRRYRRIRTCAYLQWAAIRRCHVLYCSTMRDRLHWLYGTAPTPH